MEVTASECEAVLMTGHVGSPHNSRACRQSSASLNSSVGGRRLRLQCKIVSVTVRLAVHKNSTGETSQIMMVQIKRFTRIVKNGDFECG